MPSAVGSCETQIKPASSSTDWNTHSNRLLRQFISSHSRAAHKPVSHGQRNAAARHCHPHQESAPPLNDLVGVCGWRFGAWLLVLRARQFAGRTRSGGSLAWQSISTHP